MADAESFVLELGLGAAGGLLQATTALLLEEADS